MSAVTTRHFFKPHRRLSDLMSRKKKFGRGVGKISGKKIGLLGGSFNPAHDGHRAASLLAMKIYGLDEIWWLVANKNPLKNKVDMKSGLARAVAAQKISRHPRIKIKTLPDGGGGDDRYQFSYHAVRYILKRYPKNNYVFIMGSDCWHEFHRWYRYRKLAAILPFIIIGRNPTAELYKKPRAAMFIKNTRRCPNPLNHMASSRL